MTASDRFTMKRYFNFKTKAVFTFYFTSDQCLQSECLSDFVWMKTLNWTEIHKEIGSRSLEVFNRHLWVSCQKELPKLWRKHRRRLIYQIAKERMWSKVHLQVWRSQRYYLENLLKLSILHRQYGMFLIFYWLTRFNFHDFKTGLFRLHTFTLHIAGVGYFWSKIISMHGKWVALQSKSSYATIF